MRAAARLAESVGVKPACAALGVSRATWYRYHRPKPKVPAGPRPRPPLALSPEEYQEVLDLLNSERFVDCSPRQVWATLLDEDQRYLCSVRTMYRVLEVEGELRERRNQLRHPAYSKPELLATGPNQVWTWDVTKLKGPAKWTYYYLYVILDLYSRMAVGWMVASRESAELAKQLISETVEKYDVEPDQLTLHADRGAIQTAKGVALLLADLGITKSHNRPYTSSDNPFSEAQFKTLKYHSTFPERFGSQEDARAFSGPFFDWYNNQHRHSSLALLCPADVHYGRGQAILDQRAEVLRAAFEANPKRFKYQLPSPGKLPGEVWINPNRERVSSPPGPGRNSGPESVERHKAEVGRRALESGTAVVRPPSSGSPAVVEAEPSGTTEAPCSTPSPLSRNSGPESVERHKAEVGRRALESGTAVVRPPSSGSPAVVEGSTFENGH